MKTLLFILLFLTSYSSFSCLQALELEKKDCDLDIYDDLEDQILKKINLFGDNWAVDEVYLGYYNYMDETGRCNHNFIAFYYKEVMVRHSYYQTIEKEPIFRYFNYSEGGILLKPTEFLRPYQPFKSNAKSASYNCEQKKEYEYLVAWNHQNECPQNYSKALISSMVLSQDNFPFCEYNMFTMNQAENNDGKKEVILYHYQLDETGQSIRHPLPIKIHAKKISL